MYNNINIWIMATVPLNMSIIFHVSQYVTLLNVNPYKLNKPYVYLWSKHNDIFQNNKYVYNSREKYPNLIRVSLKNIKVSVKKH